ncbi:MAG TPA: hypothetical protein VF395_10010, partial [Polyangiaceae bacterium]
MPPSLNSPSSDSGSRGARSLSALGSLALSGLALSVFGCSTTDSTAVGPAGPPVLGIQSLYPAGGSETAPEDAKSCLSLGRDPNETLTVALVSDPALSPGTIENWSLEPPFACIGTPQCGYVMVTVDPG